MAKISVKAGTTSLIVNVFIMDSSSTTGAGKTGLAYNTASLTAYYCLPGAAAAAITLATQTVTGAYSSGGFVEIDATNMPGWYRFDVPNAAIASGRFSSIHFKGAANMAPLPLEIELTAVDNSDAVRFGLTALPNVNSGSAGAIITSGTGTAQLSVSGGVGQADVAKWLGTAASTPTVAGVPNVNCKTWNDLATVALPLVPTTAGRTLDVSAGGEAGIDWANVGSPTTVVGLTNTTVGVVTLVTTCTTVTNQLTAAAIATGVWQDSTAGDFTAASSIGKSLYTAGVVPGGSGGLFISGSNTGTTTFGALTVTGATTLTGAVSLGSTLGVTGAITFSSTLTSGNISANLIGNITGNLSGSVGSVTGAVGSVTGNVGGNVTGSVGSVVGAVGSVTGNVTGTIGGLTAAALKDFFDTDSLTTYASAVAGSVVKEIADNAGGTGLTAAAIADAVWDEDATAHQTGGTFGQAIGDPGADTNTIFKAVVTDATGATVGADIVAMKIDTAAILVDTGTTLDGRIPAALTGAGNMKVDVLAINGSTTAAAAQAKGAKAIATAVVGVGSTTTSIVLASISTAGGALTVGDADQLKGRPFCFDDDTTTTQLRGQWTDITANTTGATPTLTVTALTRAPANGDTITIF